MQQPSVIKYNLHDRGRQYRGTERNYNVKAIVDSINGGPTQERVKTRGMLGYFGHWPRLRFGMEPPEGGVVDGQAQAIEPAVVTTHLAAFDDGTVEHKTEFLDNTTGNIVAKMYANRVGGFSSAIDVRKPELFGFDWVNDPNYSTNRGYDLLCDSVVAGEVTLDQVFAEEQAQQQSMIERLVATLEANNRIALDRCESLERTVEELMEMVERAKGERPRGLGDLVTDGVIDRAHALESEVAAFKDADLPMVHDPVASAKQDRGYLKVRRRVIGH